MFICLERGADLHTVQLMALPLTVSCISKIKIGLPFWYQLTRIVTDKGPLNARVCVLLQARRGLPTGRADIGLQPCYENASFLRTLRRDFEKVRALLQLVVTREKLKREQVCLLRATSPPSHHLYYITCVTLPALLAFLTRIFRHRTVTAVLA